MSAPTVEEVMALGRWPVRGLDSTVVSENITAATAEVEDRITAYIENVGALTVSDAEEKRLILLLACQKCSVSARTLLSDSAGGLSSTYVKDENRFLVEFHSEWIRLAGVAGGSYAINKGWL